MKGPLGLIDIGNKGNEVSIIDVLVFGAHLSELGCLKDQIPFNKLRFDEILSRLQRNGMSIYNSLTGEGKDVFLNVMHYISTNAYDMTYTDFDIAFDFLSDAVYDQKVKFVIPKHTPLLAKMRIKW